MNLTTRVTNPPTTTGLQYKLTNVIITSYSTSGSAGSVVPTETLSLNYEEVKVTY